MKHLSRFYRPQPKLRILYAAAVGFSLLALLLGLLLGSVSLSPSELFSESGRHILRYVRLPRALSCFLAGAALAVAGAVIQGVLGNHLASPGLLGVNAGAGLAVTVCTALGCFGGWQMALFSFLGAFGAVLLILPVAKSGASRGTVILAGVALNSLLNALSSAIVTLSPQVGVMSNDFKVGDFSAVTYTRLIPAAAVILPVLAAVLSLSNELELMSLGEENACGLGLHTGRMRPLLLLLAALLAGSAVTLAGLLSFVGLIVPHAVRMLGGRASRHLLPLSALLGGGFVTLCDLVARCAFAPYEIPVGIIMAFIGAPFFLYLLLRKGGRKTDAGGGGHA